MKTVNELQEKHNELINQFRTGIREDELLVKIRANEKELKAAKIQAQLNKVNSNQKRLRELAKIAWNCECPSEDITTDSGYFHKTKVKKYPNLAALNYAHASFDNGKLIKLSINGEKFSMYYTIYDSNKPNEYKRPESFEQFLDLNSIQPADITTEELSAINQANEELSQKFKEFEEKLSAEYKKLNMYQLNNLGLFNQQTSHVRTYRLNY